MKKYLFLIFCLGGCKTKQNIPFVNVSKKVYKVQDKEANRFAASAYIGRKLLDTKIKNFCINKSDTLFLIERVGEPDLDIWCNIWTSKRDVVYEYESESDTFKDTTFSYKSWQNPYKTNVERFDTTSLDKSKILGGYRTFLTQVVQGKKINTFFFHDQYSSFNIKK